MKIGQAVICVDDSNQRDDLPKITKGDKYIIHDTSSCCSFVVSIGMRINPKDACCATCFKPDGSNPNYAYYRASRFRVIEEYRTVEIAKEVKELELTQN